MIPAAHLSVALGRFVRHRFAVVGLIVLVLLALAVLAAPAVEQALAVDANAVDLFNRFAAPSLAHPLGTDELGRDLLVRLLYGGRVSLFVGLVVAVTSALTGTLIGVVAGYFGGWFDSVLMRLTDGIIALPLLPVLIVLAALDLGKLGLPAAIASSEDVSLYRIIVIVSLFGWTTVARLVRSSALVLRQQTFVLAARAQGAGHGRIMSVHILPNLMTPIVVATTLAAGNIILLESVLSFLGLGIQPPTPSWGNQLTNAQELIWSAPALAVYPGLLILIVVIALNFLGEGLREALDPRSTRR